MNNLIEVEFAIFVIEGVAEKLGIAGDAAYRLLAVETNVLQDYVTPSFDVLHTQGKTYVVDDVIGAIRKNEYDIIEGGIANDRVFDTVELYSNGLIDKLTALQRLKFEKPNYQICFSSQRAIDECLSFEGSYEL